MQAAGRSIAGGKSVLTAMLRGMAILGDGEAWRVLWRSLALTAAAFACVVGGVWWALYRTTLFETGWLDRTVDILGGLAVAALTWLLFPAVATLVIPFFLERLVVAVESRWYPGLPPPRPQPLAEGLAVAARMAAALILVNLAVLPLYLLPGVGTAAALVVNAYLLSREYFELVALRRMDGRALRRVRRRFALRLLAAGGFIVLLFWIPLFNLLAPSVAAAFMVHVLQGLPPADGPPAP